MELDQEKGTIRVKRGNARLLVYLLSDSGLSFSQSGEYFPPPGDRYEGVPEQWHFSARTDGQNSRARFLALYIPYRNGDTPPAVEEIEEAGVRGFRVGGEKILAWWGDGETGTYQDYGQGRLFLEVEEDGGMKKYTAE